MGARLANDGRPRSTLTTEGDGSSAQQPTPRRKIASFCGIRVTEKFSVGQCPAPASPCLFRRTALLFSGAVVGRTNQALEWYSNCLPRAGMAFRFWPHSLLVVALSASLVSACGGSSPTSPSSISITVTGTGVATYTYTADVAPILNSDCVACHNSSQHESGVNLTSYAGVMQVVTPGSDQSTLARVVQPAGPMYGNLTGNRNQKVQIIYDWVVASRATQ
jgi:hypothetical protein